MDYTKKQNQNSSFFITPTDEHEVLKVISKLKPKRSAGYDNISAWFIKQTAHLLIKPLTHIINNSFSRGKFPEKMKLAKVVPIFKTGDNTLMSNYRPISLLPAFSKIIEKIAAKQLVNYLESFHLLFQKQFCFRKNILQYIH